MGEKYITKSVDILEVFYTVYNTSIDCVENKIKKLYGRYKTDRDIIKEIRKGLEKDELFVMLKKIGRKKIFCAMTAEKFMRECKQYNNKEDFIKENI